MIYSHETFRSNEDFFIYRILMVKIIYDFLFSVELQGGLGTT